FKWPLITLGVVVLVVLMLAAAAYGYDRSESGTIAKGVSIGSVNVGGLSAAHARAKLHRIFRPLSRPITLHYKGQRFLLTPQRARLHVNIDTLVDRALRASRSGWFGSRAWREISGGRVDLRLKPSYVYSRSAVNALIARIQTKLAAK